MRFLVLQILVLLVCLIPIFCNKKDTPVKKVIEQPVIISSENGDYDGYPSALEYQRVKHRERHPEVYEKDN